MAESLAPITLTVSGVMEGRGLAPLSADEDSGFRKGLARLIAKYNQAWFLDEVMHAVQTTAIAVRRTKTLKQAMVALLAGACYLGLWIYAYYKLPQAAPKTSDK